MSQIHFPKLFLTVLVHRHAMKSAFTSRHHFRVCHNTNVGSEVQSRCEANSRCRAPASFSPQLLLLFRGSSRKARREASLLLLLLLQTAFWTAVAPPFLSPVSQAFLGHTVPLARNTKHHCGARGQGSNGGQRLQMAAPAASQVCGGRWGTGSWGPKRQQQCWRKNKRQGQ